MPSHTAILPSIGLLLGAIWEMSDQVLLAIQSSTRRSRIASVKGISLEEVFRQTAQNAKAVYQL